MEFFLLVLKRNNVHESPQISTKNSLQENFGFYTDQRWDAYTWGDGNYALSEQ